MIKSPRQLDGDFFVAKLATHHSIGWEASLVVRTLLHASFLELQPAYLFPNICYTDEEPHT